MGEGNDEIGEADSNPTETPDDDGPSDKRSDSAGGQFFRIVWKSISFKSLKQLKQ